MFENPRRGRQARNFTTNVSKILDLKSSSEQIFFRKLSLGTPGEKCPQSFSHFFLLKDFSPLSWSLEQARVYENDVYSGTVH